MANKVYFDRWLGFDAGDSRRSLGVLIGVLAGLMACVGAPLLGGAGEPTPYYLPFEGTLPLTDDFAYYQEPAWSPDGNTIALIRSPTYVHPSHPSTVGDVVLVDVASGNQQIIAPSSIVKPQRAGGPVIWLAGGDELGFYYFDFFGGQQTPLIVLYNLETEQASSVEVCCAPHLARPDGTGFLVDTSSEASLGIGWLDLKTGAVTEELSLPSEDALGYFYTGFSLSPDGHNLLIADSEAQVLLYQIGSGKAPTPLLSLATDPSWSPDGSRIAYVALPGPAEHYFGQIMIAHSDGSFPQPLFLEKPPGGMRSPAWSPDGRQLAFTYGSENSNRLLLANVPESLRQ